MIAPSLWSRLRSQLDSVAVVLADAPEEAISAPAAEGNGSACDHLAHLGRMHEVLIRAPTPHHDANRPAGLPILLRTLRPTFLHGPPARAPA
jgi:hypothetical protein